jgi:SAM-dependent methyltransferase
MVQQSLPDASRSHENPMYTIRLAKFLRQRAEATPSSPTDDVGELQEVFQHPVFVNGDADQRLRVMHRSSENKFRDELAYPWDAYFGIDIAPMLRDAVCLDLGCLTGGRGAAWFERYRMRHLKGIDVQPEYVEAARAFAKSRGIDADYTVALGERLPYDDGTFDAVLSYDVFEHVRDVKQTLLECRRVLKPGGRLFVVFPGFYHPKEHHLALATRVPCIHYFFSPSTIIGAYNAILAQRGESAAWYRRSSPALEYWERGNTINGTTFAGFVRTIADTRWTIVHNSRKPIGTIGRKATESGTVRLIANAFKPLTYIPGLQEFLLHRITFVLQKPVA